MKTLCKLTLAVVICFYGFVAQAQISLAATSGTLSGSYATLNAAFAAINAGTHRGVINLTITGNTTEPSPPTPLVRSGSGSASYSSVYISPAGGDWTVHSAMVPFAYRGIIELTGAAHVTIDGDPAHTGSSHLTFEMIKTSNVEVSAIRLSSADTSGVTGAAYDTIRGCQIIGAMDSARSTILNYGIVCTEGNVSTTQGQGAYGCDYNMISGNHITRAYYGIFLNGPLRHPTAGGDRNILIRSNEFSCGYADSAFTYGVYIQGFCVSGAMDQSIIIDSNNFVSVSDADPYGIYEENMAGPVYVSNNRFQGNFRPVTADPNASISFFAHRHTLYCLNNTQEASGIGSFFSAYDYNPFDTMIVRGNQVNDISTGYGAKVIDIQGCNSFVEHNLIRSISTQQNAVTAISASNSGNFCRSIINANVIDGLTCYTSAGVPLMSGVVGIAVSGSASITNNMISRLSCELNSMTTNIGIMIDSGVSCVNNTIALNTSNQPGSDNTGISCGIRATGINCAFINNIIVNTQATGTEYGIYIQGSTYSTDTFDHNSYYIPNGNVGYAGAPRASLLQWQAAIAQDMYSVAGEVPFQSVSDLHIDTMGTGAYRVFRSGVRTLIMLDIDGQTRSNPPCIGADEFSSFVATPDSLVWPGDADANHIVDNTDLLPIGLAYDSAGPARTVQGIVWQGDMATNWPDSFGVYAPAVNYKHADCNGDGIINADDTLAILTNFSLTHAKTSGTQPYRAGMPILKAQLSADTLYAGDTLTVTFILGDNALPASNIYGLAFTYNFDPTVVDSPFTTMSFGPSWIGNADKISISKTLNNAGQIKAALTRIDHTTRSGYGPIASASFRITTDNISGKDYSYYANMGYVSDIVAIDDQGNLIQLNAGADTSQVGYEPNGIPEAANANIALYPNPAAGKVSITADDMITAVSITDITGLEVYRAATKSGNSITVDLPATVASGIYFVHVKTMHASGIAKLSVIR